jgi:hypothetical protein
MEAETRNSKQSKRFPPVWEVLLSLSPQLVDQVNNLLEERAARKPNYDWSILLIDLPKTPENKRSIIIGPFKFYLKEKKEEVNDVYIILKYEEIPLERQRTGAGRQRSPSPGSVSSKDSLRQYRIPERSNSHSRRVSRTSRMSSISHARSTLSHSQSRRPEESYDVNEDRVPRRSSIRAPRVSYVEEPRITGPPNRPRPPSNSREYVYPAYDPRLPRRETRDDEEYERSYIQNAPPTPGGYLEPEGVLYPRPPPRHPFSPFSPYPPPSPGAPLHPLYNGAYRSPPPPPPRAYYEEDYFHMRSDPGPSSMFDPRRNSINRERDLSEESDSDDVEIRISRGKVNRETRTRKAHGEAPRENRRRQYFAPDFSATVGDEQDEDELLSEKEIADRLVAKHTRPLAKGEKSGEERYKQVNGDGDGLKSIPTRLSDITELDEIDSSGKEDDDRGDTNSRDGL